MANNRRTFIKQAAQLAIGFAGLETLLNQWMDGCTQLEQLPNFIYPYGPLRTDTRGVLSLPNGFRYEIISRAGQRMSDGFFTPDKADGMATFLSPDGTVIVIRNHELMPNDQGPFGVGNRQYDRLTPSQVYDSGASGTVCQGGTTTLVYDEEKEKVVESYLSLAGTLRNCAGGPTPWNSWITCEEVVVNANEKLMQDHGYNFEVPASREVHLAEPFPLKAMGRFNHEAICVDPDTGIVYETEDRHDGLIYRFLPDEPGNLRAGGRLQALKFKEHSSFDIRNWEGEPIPVGTTFSVEWIDMDEVESPNDDLRARGSMLGAVKFARGEGMWFGADGLVYWACTNGGKEQLGQLFRYHPSPYEGTSREAEDPGQLVLMLEPNDARILKNADNLTMAPWGDLIICEDNEAPRIVGVTPEGKVYHLAENIGYASEFAGCTFSPSGKTLFVNIQHAGLTFAITGPWEKARQEQPNQEQLSESK